MAKLFCEVTETGCHDFHSEIIPLVIRLAQALHKKFPKVEPQQIAGPGMPLPANAPISQKVSQAKWVAENVVHEIERGSYLEAAKEKDWLVRFVMETEIVTYQDLQQVEP